MIIYHVHRQVPHAHRLLNRLAFVDLAVASPVVDHGKCEILLNYFIDNLYGRLCLQCSRAARLSAGQEVLCLPLRHV